MLFLVYKKEMGYVADNHRIEQQDFGRGDPAHAHEDEKGSQNYAVEELVKKLRRKKILELEGKVRFYPLS